METLFAGLSAFLTSLSGLSMELVVGLQGLWQGLQQVQKPGTIAKYKDGR